MGKAKTGLADQTHQRRILKRQDFGETNPTGKSATLSVVGACEWGTDAAPAPLQPVKFSSRWPPR
jgi:hypothetical protein